jgi:hypothetical protein
VIVIVKKHALARRRPVGAWMRRGSWLVSVVLLTALLTACRTSYQMTLNNGTIITTANKPKYDPQEKVWRAKDAQGVVHSYPAFRVQSIEPL